jgi:signal transduction histidine kinase
LISFSNFEIKAQGVDIFDSLRNVLLKTKEDSSKALIYRKIAFYYEKIGQNDTALYFLEKAIENAHKVKNNRLIARIFDEKGRIYREENEYILSENFLKRAYKLAEIEKDTAVMCDASNNLGITYRRLDDDSNALLYHILALNFAKQTADTENIATALNSLGIIYTQRQEYDKGIEHFKDAMEYEKKINRFVGVAINYNSIAWAYELKGDFKNAEINYEHSANINEQINNKQGMAICFNDLGNLYISNNKLEKARVLMEKAYKIFSETHDVRNLAYSCLNLGKLYNMQKNFSASLKMLNQCADIAEKLKSGRLQMSCYEQLSETYDKLGYFAFSLEYLKKAYELKDKINSLESEKLLAEYRTKYEYEKKDEQVNLLTENNILHEQTIQKQKVLGIFIFSVLLLSIILTFVFFRGRQKLSKAYKLLQNRQEEINVQKEILKRQKHDLEELNSSKDKFFSIIAHDLRNPFSALLTLSALVIEDFNDNTPEENREMIKLINESAEGGYRLLENLLAWAKSQSGGLKVEPERFTIKELVAEVTESMELRFKSKKIQMQNLISENSEVYADRNMVMSVLRNLISNALKFTPALGKITVSTTVESEFVKICVRDTGIGIEPKNIKKLFRIDENYTRKGTEKEPGSGLGLILCKEFVEKNNGKIFVESEVNKGSDFIFTLPKNRTESEK